MYNGSTCVHCRYEGWRVTLGTLHYILYVGIGGQAVTIVTDPAGVPVDGQNNTFDYPILTSVTLMCIAADKSSANVTSYHWNVISCYNNSRGVDDPCFYGNGQRIQNITGNDLLAQDAGTVSCTATINGTDHTSDPLTLRISGELDMHIHTYVFS